MTRFLLTCLLWVVTGSSLAQTFACQFVASAGLQWEGGSWVTKTFKKDQPFFIGLNQDGKTIDTKTISKKLLTYPTCDEGAFISCFDGTGALLLFALSAMKGAYVQTIGSVIPDSRPKDTLSVSPFICQKM